jgi:SulP family sulfate permease
MDWKKVSAWVPATAWIPRYQKANLRGDVIAGLTTAIMLIPQGMAYAMLAGLPPIVGLYSALVPLLVYGLLGTSRELAVGPVAMDSLLVAASVGAIATQGTEQYITYALMLALMTGVIQLVMGIGRLGFVVNFLSRPVLAGFTSAAALIIGSSQLKHMMGVKLPRSTYVHEVIAGALGQIGQTHLITLGIGVASVAALVVLKKKWPMFPRALTVVVVGTLAVWGLGLDEMGVAIVGDVPAGLPGFALPVIDMEVFGDLVPSAFAIALVAFMEAISVGKAYARRAGYDLDPNQELVALGSANIAGSFFGIYPVTGGLSRTAVNAQSGARTQLAGMITAVVIGVALLLFTPLFYYLPKAVLASIIMTAVVNMIDIKEMRRLWKVKRSDLALLAITSAATLGLGIQQGIMVGVGASLLWFIIRTTRPHSAVLGQLPGQPGVYRNVERFPNAETWPGMLILRVDAQFYFGNVTFLKTRLRELEKSMSDALKVVVIDASSINQLDGSANAALHEILDDYRERGVELLFAGVKGPVRDVMRRSGFYQQLGEARFYFLLEDAVCAARCTLGCQDSAPGPCEAEVMRSMQEEPPRATSGAKDQGRAASTQPQIA